MSGSASRPPSSRPPSFRQSPTVAIVVTHIAPARGYGGIAECTARVAQAWGEAGHEVILCASDASEGAPLRPDELGLPGRVSPVLYRARGWPRWGFGLGALPAIWTGRPASSVERCNSPRRPETPRRLRNSVKWSISPMPEPERFG